MVALSLALLGVSTVRAIESYQLLEGQAAVEHLYEGNRLSQEDAELIVRSRERALAWIGRGQSYKDIAFAKFRERRPLEVGDRGDRLDVSPILNSLERGLKRAPVDPRAWLVLARLRAIQSDEAGAIAALHHSLVFGENVIPLAAARAAFGLQYWPSLDTELKAKLRKQLSLAFISNSRNLLPSIRAARVPDRWKEDLASEQPDFLKLLQSLS